ncbi:MAG TPA: hypothetical protein VL981_03030 [Candidatus Methylacidiphilales bacterium]|nr:hypothetical protein [Candidatus Methylacidiphilales bacterium]
MTTSDQILTLLYSSNGWVSESDLRTWVEYKNPTDFRSKRLKPLHKDRFIEFDAVKQRVHLTTRGTKDVEDRILPKYV